MNSYRFVPLLKYKPLYKEVLFVHLKLLDLKHGISIGTRFYRTSKIEVPKDVRSSKSGDMTCFGKTGLILKHLKVSNGTGPGVERVKHPLFASASFAKLMFNGSLSEFGKKVLNRLQSPV